MIGEIFNDCEIKRKIAVATTGTIYEAVDSKLHVSRAIKILHPQLVTKQVVRDRFRLALHAWAKLDHPNFAHVFSAIESEETLGFIMDYVDGIPLSEIISKQGRLGISQAIEYFLQVAQALAYAHKFNILHRKLSPANIMVTREENVKILGMGAVRDMNEKRVTPTNFCIGKGLYMAPEQFDGIYNSATEQYTLGAILYEMVAGKPPWEQNPTSPAEHSARLKNKPTPPGKFNPELTPELEGIIMKALAPKPEDRFAHVKELIDEIAAATDRLNISSDLSVYSLMSHGRKALERRKLENAIYFFNKVLSVYGRETPYFAEAQQKRDEAVKMKMEEENIRQMRGWAQEALDYFEEEEIEYARENVEKIVRMTKSFPNSPRIRGASQDVTREMPELVREVANSIEREKQKSEELTQKARIVMENEEYDEAITILDRALFHDKNNKKAIQLKNFAEKKKKISLAATRYRDGLEALKNRKYAEAVSLFNQVVQLNPSHQKAQQRLDRAMAEKDRLATKRLEMNDLYRKALRDYEKWNYTEAIDKFNRYLSWDDKHEQANELLELAKRRLDEDSEIEDIGFFFQRGVNFFERQQWREAVVCFNKVLAYMESHKKAREYIEIAEHELQKQELFERVFDDALQLFENSSYNEALERFEYLLKLDAENKRVQEYKSMCIEFMNGF